MSLPKHIGRYEIRSEIKRGGMATIYLGHDPRFDRDVAIKVLPHEMLHDETFRARFEREAHVIASLEHPAIVPVYDFGEEGDQPYLVMRYMTGGSLEDKIKQGPVQFDEAVRIITCIAQALDEAHARGIVHRDLKPGNILFDHRNEPYISDFGIAKIAIPSKSLTAATVIGTPAYMSPEQARGEKNIDQRSDIYALGAILFEMLSGQVPFDAETPTGQMLRHITDPVPDILTLNNQLPPECQAVINRAMAKQPFTRYASTIEMANDLEKIARGESVSKYQKTMSIPKLQLKQPSPLRKMLAAHRWYRWAGVGAVCVIGVTLFSIFIVPSLKPRNPKPAQGTDTPASDYSKLWFTPTALPTTKVAPTSTPSSTSTLTPAPSLTPLPENQFVALDMSGQVEYKSSTGNLYRPLELGVPVSFTPGLALRTAASGLAKIRLSDSSILYLGKDTSLVIASITNPGSVDKTEIRIQQGILVVDSGGLTVNTTTGQSAENQGGIMEVSFGSDVASLRVDCLDGNCFVSGPNRTPMKISTGQSVWSSDWIIVPVDCTVWDPIGGYGFQCENTPTPETVNTLTSTSTSTPTKTVYFNPPDTPTKTKSVRRPTKTSNAPPPPP